MADYKILVRPPRHRRRRWIAVGLIVLVAAAVAGAFVVGRHDRPSPVPAAEGGATTTTVTSAPLSLTSTTPASGSIDVPSSQVVTINFSSPVSIPSEPPVFNPPVSGTWKKVSPASFTFAATAPFIPTTAETLTIPAGAAGPRSAHGAVLVAPVTVSFTVAQSSTERLQQLLGQLGYLPLSFTPSGPLTTPAQAATAQSGAFAWRWPTVPTSLTALWTEGSENVITKGAVMTFESQHGLNADGLAGRRVWSALLADVAGSKADTVPYTYVHVAKQLPETLTLYNNGAPTLANIPVNTGAPGADTTDGTYPVFEHVTSSRMQGTNPDGSHYDDPNVPWASYFYGGDALHGFVRATYGSPQSNGCVEMAISDAAQVWPLTPIGTLVTVDGPSS